jgi:hypothetical protein
MHALLPTPFQMPSTCKCLSNRILNWVIEHLSSHPHRLYMMPPSSPLTYIPTAFN